MLRGYTPLTEVEQEVIERLVSAEDMYVEVVGWGFCENPYITFGDKRVQVSFPWTFTKPAIAMPVTEFKMRLKRRDGSLLYEDVVSTVHNKQPLIVQEGLEIVMVWDIQIGHLAEDLIGKIKKGLRGKIVRTL